MSESTFEPHEFNSAFWRKLQAVYQNRLQTLQLQLEGNLNEVETAKVRGRIKEIRKMLDLPKVQHVEADAD